MKQYEYGFLPALGAIWPLLGMLGVAGIAGYAWMKKKPESIFRGDAIAQCVNEKMKSMSIDGAIQTCRQIYAPGGDMWIPVMVLGFLVLVPVGLSLLGRK